MTAPTPPFMLDAAASGGQTSEGAYAGGRFKIVLRQQPARARMCGFSDIKDRRLVDPPPVIQLIVLDRQGNEVLASPEELPHWICHVSLIAATTSDDRNVIVKPSRKSASNAVASVGASSTAGDQATRSSNEQPVQQGFRQPQPKASQNHPRSQPKAPPPERRSFRPWSSDDKSAATVPLGLVPLSHHLVPTPVPSQPTGSPSMGFSGPSSLHVHPSHQHHHQHLPSHTSTSSTIETSRSSMHLTSGGTGGSSSLGDANNMNVSSSNSVINAQTSHPSASSATVPDPSRYIQTLVGATVASCEQLTDTDDRDGMFFVYNDLSIRPQGTYRLKFMMVYLDL
ncbi:hypothetical protein HKX48_008578 [Thoreauomyces humboldtii]|nr:hypothetical protein HKX48_008578 [Thoreauomyces humboldtii]